MSNIQNPLDDYNVNQAPTSFYSLRNQKLDWHLRLERELKKAIDDARKDIKGDNDKSNTEVIQDVVTAVNANTNSQFASLKEWITNNIVTPFTTQFNRIYNKVSHL